MELKVKGSTETFHVGRNLGKAMLAIGGGKIEEVKAPKLPGVIDPEEEASRDRRPGVIDPADAANIGPTKWTWNYPESKRTAIDIIRVQCPRCHKADIFVSDKPNILTIIKRGFVHCGKTEYASAELIEAFTYSVTVKGKAVKKILDERQRKKDEEARIAASMPRVLG